MEAFLVRTACLHPFSFHFHRASGAEKSYVEGGQAVFRQRGAHIRTAALGSSGLVQNQETAELDDEFEAL